MIRDDVFVFDNVVHMYDYSDENLISEKSEYDRHYHVSKVLGRRRTAPTDVYANWHPVEGFKRRWSVEDMGRLVFEDSGTDMAMAQAVPLFDLYKDGFAPVKAQYAFAQAYPERCLFCGAVDPMYPSVAAACEEMERQVKEWGAKSIKIYNAHVDGKSWACDDPEIAYPLYEKGRELGSKSSSSTRETPSRGRSCATSRRSTSRARPSISRTCSSASTTWRCPTSRKSSGWRTATRTYSSCSRESATRP